MSISLEDIRQQQISDMMDDIFRLRDENLSLQDRLCAAETELSRYSMSAGEADQRASESRAIRLALGFDPEGDDVAPVDLTEAIIAMKAELVAEEQLTKELYEKLQVEAKRIGAPSASLIKLYQDTKAELQKALEQEPVAYSIVNDNGIPLAFSVEELRNFTAEDKEQWLSGTKLYATPVPAQQDEWRKAVLHECMMTEACYVESDPLQSVKNLIDWHIDNERFHVKQQTKEE
jgi:hypothetical protein